MYFGQCNSRGFFLFFPKDVLLQIWRDDVSLDHVIYHPILAIQCNNVCLTWFLATLACLCSSLHGFGYPCPCVSLLAFCWTLPAFSQKYLSFLAAGRLGHSRTQTSCSAYNTGPLDFLHHKLFAFIRRSPEEQSAARRLTVLATLHGAQPHKTTHMLPYLFWTLIGL